MKALPKYNVEILPLLFILYLFIMDTSISTASAQQVADASVTQQQDDWQAELTKKISLVNRLWRDKQGDLQLAVEVLELATTHNARAHYRLGSFFYLWSLKQADITKNAQAIEQETARLLPLLPDDKKDQWETYLEDNDPQLLREIYGFWVSRDASPSTEVNERLVEHWQRIAYAREHFTKNGNSPYGTDDRGTIFVRLGPPDLKREETIEFDSVTDPLGRSLQLKSGLTIRGTFELWNYYKHGKDGSFFIFGNHKAQGPYGLQNSIIDIFDLSDVDFQQGVTSKVALYGIFKRMRTYENQYDKLVRRVEFSFNSSTVNSVQLTIPVTRINNAFPGGEHSQDVFDTRVQMQRAPDEASTITDNSLEVRHRFYRFWDEQDQPRYIFAAAAHPQASYTDSATYYTQNNFYAYNNNWELQGHESRASRPAESPVVFTLNNMNDKFQLYFSSELLGLTSQATATLVAASGKQKLEQPEPLPKAKPFTVSDVVLADEQQPNYDNELPIVPKLEYTFGQNQPVMIYFEAYNLPEGGYSFTYFFKKDRWLLSNKKIERTEITILADQAKDRDSQLFSINPNDLEPGIYEVIFQFNPLDNSSDIEPVEKTVEIEITE